ncbi:5-formyltetrahydrofolate cyclo-ligase [Aeromicrobium sp. Leaf350]|uniref:5-formyltetrahydrofolate cyclo-ligase n=1 Tax=Aeromicrobium sp. Leaf350 TaxID=2876565 RepID=UPI001E4F3393|nr:5-formyltetrahydrofolate cyclo-ligase [Aeromicrobium sp. Leaf350]
MGPTFSAKNDLRRILLATRRGRTDAALADAGQAIAAHLSGDRALRGARRVAAYLSMKGEPPTGPLLADLRAACAEVVVPVTRPDGTLAWVSHDPQAETVRSAIGVDEPVAEPLPASPLGDLDLVLVPALAVDHHGRRLGRGAGYYDRALAEVVARSDRPRPLLCAVVFTDELLAEVPHESHDVPVDLVLTPGGVFRPER